ncbi:hypothetical protein C6A37_01600 [Desulfobacteraceae bacterium SEEP-SAG9]|nr:hypothetical protein C6A37_01600 [Desulfobacteraceae bacterium SEEP-SAG9]
MKTVIIFGCIIFMIVALRTCNIRTLTYITIIFIFFPIYIPFMDRDAITTGTLCTFFLYFRYLIDSLRTRTFIKEKYDYLIYLLIIFGAISIMSSHLTGVLEQEQVGPAFRHFFGSLGALLLFLVIKNYHEDKFESNFESFPDHIEKLLSIFLFMTSFHIFASIIVKIIPSLESAFSIFFPRNVDVLNFSYQTKGVTRIKSFVMTPESYGEFLATLSPIILYKIFRFRNPLWLVVFFLFFLGEIFAVTRSGIILFLAGVAFLFLYHLKEKIGIILSLSYIFLTAFILILYLEPSLFGDVLLRFSFIKESHEHGGTLIDTLNRKVFIDAWDVTISNLSFFGNCLSEFNFHNLLLTTLHEKGIGGTTLFFVVLFYPMVRLVKSIRNHKLANKALIFSCLLSMVLFFINETKYEFTRSDSYQQICWALFGTYYLVSQQSLLQKE